MPGMEKKSVNKMKDSGITGLVSVEAPLSLLVHFGYAYDVGRL